MSLRRMVAFILLLACVITTIYLLYQAGLHFFLYQTTNIRVRIPIHELYRFPLFGIICTLPSLIFVNTEKTTKLGWNVRVILHFILTYNFTLSAIILLWGEWRGWLHYLWLLIPGHYGLFSLIFLMIYLSALTTYNFQQKKLSQKMNERIKELSKNGNE